MMQKDGLDRRPTPCPGCGRIVKACGLQMHMQRKGCRTPVPPMYRPARPPQDDDFDLFDDGGAS